MEIKTLNELRQRASRVLSYMDKFYGDAIMYGRITLARNLLSDVYKKNISLEEKIRITQDIINRTAYHSKEKFQL